MTICTTTPACLCTITFHSCEFDSFLEVHVVAVLAPLDHLDGIEFLELSLDHALIIGQRMTLAFESIAPLPRG